MLAPVTPGRTRLSAMLADAGATVVEVQFLSIEPPADARALTNATLAWCDGRYDWLAVTSRNAVLGMAAEARALGRSLAEPVDAGRAAVASVGDATRSVCDELGVPVALIPAAEASARGLVDAFPAGGGRVLAPQGNLASPVLERGLARKGWDVTAVEAYRTVEAETIDAGVAAALAGGGVDAVLLTSGSMVRSLMTVCPRPHPSVTMVAIGDTTAAAARAAGLRVAAVAKAATYESLVEALAGVDREERE